MTGLDLATCSYTSFVAEMGVPVGTSVGKHPAYRECPQADAVKPWGVFKKMKDRPLTEQHAAYDRSLDNREDRVWSDLHRIAEEYAGQRLVLLCWCNLAKVGGDGCHRRWFATWAGDRGLDVPELSTPA